MPFEIWPYTNFHDLNLDWIMKQFPLVYQARDAAQEAAEGMEDIKTAAEKARDDAEAAQLAAEAAQGYAEGAANDAHNSAVDAQATVDSALNTIGTTTAGLVADWLAAHVDPDTGYVIDDTLTVEGAAADARKTGYETSGLRDFWVQLQNPSITWEQGGIDNGTGANTTDATVIRSGFIEVPNTIAMEIAGINEDPMDPAVYVDVYRYSSNNVADYIGHVPTLDGNFVMWTDAGSYLRFTIRYQNSANIAPGDESIGVTQYAPTDSDLTYALGVTGHAADSGAVGDAIRATQSMIPGLDNTLSLAGNFAAGAKATGDAINSIDNELLTHRMDFEQGGILSITSYNEYTINTSNIRVHTIAHLSPPSVTIDPKESGASYQVAVFDSNGNLLGSEAAWKTDRYYLESNAIAEIRISIKKVVSGSDVIITPQGILDDGFTVSVDPEPLGTFRDVTTAFTGFTPSKIKVLGFNAGMYSYGQTNGYAGADVQDKIAGWKSFLSKYNADILGIQEFYRWFDSSQTISALDTIWKPLYKYSYNNLLNTVFSIFPIVNTTSGYLGASDDATKRYYVKGYITIQGKKICVMVVHLSPAIPDAVAKRAVQINDLLTILATEKRFIVFGDFNVASTDEYNPFLSAGYSLANGGYLGWMNTHYPQSGTQYFDNIIVSPNIVISNYNVLYDEYNNLTSDHYPTIAELTVY